MEVRIRIDDKFLKAAAGILDAMVSEEENEERINSAVMKSKDAVVDVDLSDFGDAEAKQLALALSVYVITKKLEEV